MRVSEWFYSIQGEGVTAGKPSLFIRLSGCNFMSIGVKKGVSSPEVWTSNKNIPIQELHVGDTILAVDENNQVVDTTVQALFEYELDEWIEIIVERPHRYEDTKVQTDRFLCSPEHPWLTNRGWVRASDLRQTDEIYFVDYKEKLSHRMKGDNNPIHDPAVMKKHLENTDWEAMGKTQAATIGRKKEDGTYVGGILRLRDLDPERYEELRQKHSKRLTENNPMHNPEVVRKSAGMHQNINEHYPYMSLSEKKFAEMCQSQGLPVEYVGRFDLPIQHNGKTHYPDFRVQGTNRLIEVYWDTGKFSHRQEEWKAKKLEAYRANGYECTFANFAVVPEVRDQVDALKEEMLVHNGRTILSLRKFKYKEKWWNKEEGVSISRNRLKAYDLTCAPYNTFIVDGLVTHNCGGFKAKLLAAKKATWYCDTESVWKAGRDMTVDELMEEIFTKYPDLKTWIAEDKANIILTGGEPTLPHNIEAIEEIQEWFYSRQIFPYYEVETNGSVVVDYDTLFDQINASPKLANSGMPARLRQNREAINVIKLHRNAWFKFVVNIDSDIEEIEKEWVGEMGVPEDRIILMPGVDKLEHLQSTSLFAAEKAIERGWRFSSRLQVSIWDQTTGV